MMKSRKFIIIASLALLIAVTTTLVAAAMSSTNYQMQVNAIAGGGAGGGTASSGSYSMETSIGGIVQISNTSASYEKCTGFICFGAIWKTFLPFLSR
jgi:hypothetical protein